MSLSTRTRYWTAHVACAVLGPSIAIGFDKELDDPVASPLQPANAWRSIPLTRIIDEFTDAMPKDPAAYDAADDCMSGVAARTEATTINVGATGKAFIPPSACARSGLRRLIVFP